MRTSTAARHLSACHARHQCQVIGAPGHDALPHGTDHYSSNARETCLTSAPSSTAGAPRPARTGPVSIHPAGLICRLIAGSGHQCRAGDTVIEPISIFVA